MPSDMEHIESVLTARAKAMGVEIRRGFGVETFEQSDNEVAIRAGGEAFLGRWLVGCDGGRSTVRKVGGFEFIGTDPEFTGYSLQVEWPSLISSSLVATTRRPACIRRRNRVWSQWLISMAALSTAPMRPSPASRALVGIVRELIDTRDGATYFAERVWGVSIRYDMAGNHPVIGRSAPDFEFADGTRLGELLRNGRGLLLDFEGSPALQALAARWSDRITYLGSDAKDRVGLNALLVRPDGFVAWASEGTPDYEETALSASRWFGEPSR